ncbi:MAG: NAD(P)/FAD-dependent oxidoreductase, partial [Lachnospiraceae bacterium]|nr:NAD(P)/FAD-dependent oxidoreductase [Lachnospiraceae bacterium]
GSMPTDVGDDNTTVNGRYEKDAGFWEDRWNRQSMQTMDQFVTGLVNKKIGLLLLKLAGIRETDRAADVPKAARVKLAGLFRSFPVVVKGTNSFEQAQVCAGGVDCREVTRTLESKIVPHLFFAGEILDIDGICGGYNLQWAWSSGIVAGRAAAHAL